MSKPQLEPKHAILNVTVTVCDSGHFDASLVSVDEI